MTPWFKTLVARVALISLGAVGGIVGTLSFQPGNDGAARLDQHGADDKVAPGQLGEAASPLPSPIMSGDVSPVTDSAIQDRLAKQITAAVQTTVARELDQGATAAPGTAASQNASAVPAAPQQQKTYESLREDLHNPVYNQTLTWNQLVTDPQVQSLPKELRDKLLGEVAEMLTRGELNPDYFLLSARTNN